MSALTGLQKHQEFCGKLASLFSSFITRRIELLMGVMGCGLCHCVVPTTHSNIIIHLFTVLITCSVM
jgi:hypothetical protein